MFWRLFGALLVCGSLGLSAQGAPRPLQVPVPAQPGPVRDIEEALRPSIRAYAGRTGLPNSTVYNLSEDGKGRLWAATKDGASAFDGRAWTNLNIPGANSSQSVRVILHSRDGSHWLGLENGGLWQLKNGTWTAFKAGEGLPHERVNHLLEVLDSDGSPALWVGTGGGGVARFKQGQWQSWSTGEGMPSNFIWKLLLFPDDRGQDQLWAATTHGFARFDGQRWSALGAKDGFPDWEVNDLVQLRHKDGRRDVWLSSWDHGLARRDGAHWQTFTPSNGFPSLRPTMLCTTPGSDGEPTLWIATYDAGLVSLDRGGWKVLNEEKGLPADGVYAILPSQSGRPDIWLGLRGAGVVAVDRKGWLNLDKGRELPSNSILAFLDSRSGDGQGRFWVGTERGLAAWDGRSWHQETRAEGLEPGPVAVLLQDPEDGTLWAGGMKGLARRRGQRWEPFHDPVLRQREITCLAISREPGAGKTLWIGTEQGLIRYSGQRFEPVLELRGVPKGGIYALAVTRGPDGETTLWAGSRGGGLARRVKGRWLTITSKDGLPNDWVYCFHALTSADGSRWLWAGTFGGGLARISLDQNDAPWTVFNAQNLPGLPSNSIVGIESDAMGRLYLATSNGVARINFENRRQPSLPTRTESFNLADGLPALQCNLGAFMKDGRGRIWVGSNHGAAMLDPAREAPPPPSRTIILDRVLVRGQERALAPGARLSHRESYLTFECFLPSFHRGEEIRYRTQLEGLETEPGPWTSEGRREFPALPSGHFTLRVWAMDYRGTVTGPLAFPFQIRPAPWLSPWAYLSYILGTALCLLAGHGLRVRSFQLRNRRLKRKVAEATEALRLKNEALERANEEMNQFMGFAAHDLRNPLNGIVLAITQIREEAMPVEDLNHFHAMIERAALQMSDLLKNMLDVNRLDTGHLNLACQAVDPRLLAQELAMDYQERAAHKHITLVLDLAAEPLEAWADPLHLREVMENLLSNALKFTPRTPQGHKVWLRVSREWNQVLVAVQDEGPGFSAADKAQAFGRFQRLSARPTGGEPSSGLGLSIAKALTEAMGGRLELESAPGQGATLRVLLAQGPDPAS